MALGSAMAIIHGSALPLLMLVFGELINIFIFQEQSDIIASCLSVSRDCNQVFQLPNLGLNDSINCSSIPEPIPYVAVANQTLDEIVRTIFGNGAECLTDDEFTDRAVLNSIYFVIIAVGVFVFAYIEIAFFQMACERQVRKIRLHYYRAVLRQNIGWFDSNPSGELASRLNE